MQYNGIRYQIRARPGKNKWSWTVYLGVAKSNYLGVAKSKSGETSGPRQRAVLAARAAIDLWLRQNPSAESKTSKTEQSKTEQSKTEQSKTEQLPDDVAPASRPGSYFPRRPRRARRRTQSWSLRLL